MTVYSIGQTIPWQLQFYNQQSGALTDPSAVSMSISYGDSIPDGSQAISGGGPFAYSGASVSTSGQIWRVTTGVYQLDWIVPTGIVSGVYIANWLATYGPNGDVFPAFDNQTIASAYGLGSVPAPVVDVGYWTGQIANPDGTMIPLGQVDANGIGWQLLKVQGWDSPPTSGQVVQRSNDHGGFATPQFYGARQITATIQATAPTQVLRDFARTLLQRAVPVNRLATFTYNEPTPKSAQVRRSGAVTETYPTLMDVVFTVGLVAPDPRKYGAARNALANGRPVVNGITTPLTPPVVMPPNAPPATVAVTNAGNFETRPVITLAGPISAPAAVNLSTGQTVSWTNLVMAAGDVMTIDMDAKQGILNGQLVAADFSSAWWVLPPGPSTVSMGGSPASGSWMNVAWSDAYM
jgi:hypothetical protein